MVVRARERQEDEVWKRSTIVIDAAPEEGGSLER
jgi:hypothetical protein